MTDQLESVAAPLGSRLASAIRRIRIRIVERCGCWIWTGPIDRKGYARFRGPTGRTVSVHRFTFELLKGPIPDGLTIDHLCRNPSCCNPAHLEAVTNQENIRRGTQGQFQLRKTHCPRGHEYTPENTYRPPSGERLCRECQRANWRRQDERKKEQRRQEARA